MPPPNGYVGVGQIQRMLESTLSEKQRTPKSFSLEAYTKSGQDVPEASSRSSPSRGQDHICTVAKDNDVPYCYALESNVVAVLEFKLMA